MKANPKNPPFPKNINPEKGPFLGWEREKIARPPLKKRLFP